MTKRRKVIPWLALVVALNGLSCSCPPSTKSTDAARKAQQRQKSKPDTLVIHLGVEPAHLVYMLKPDAWVFRMTVHNVLEGLIRINPKTSEYEGELASSWKIEEDGLTYTFELRRDARWHDGKPFSAADVKFTLDRILDERVQAASTRASIEAFIDRYEVVDPHRFRIVCKQRSFFFLQNLAALMILPAHRMRQGDLNRHPLLRKPIGTGPYRFVSWDAGRQIVLERFDGYWGTPKPRIRRLVWRIVRSPAVALRLARRGEIDVVPRVEPGAWRSEVQRDPIFAKKFHFTRHLTPGVAFVLFNHQRTVLQDARVRRALTQLLDVDDVIIKRIMGGLALRSPTLYWPKDPAYDPSIKALPFDPAAGRALLAEAGFVDRDRDGVVERAGKPLRLTFMVPAISKSARRWVTAYQQELRKAGVKLEIQALEWATFIQRVRDHDYDLAAMGIQISGVYTDLFLQLHSSQIEGGQNYAAYSNKALDRLLEQIRTEMDDSQRRRLTTKVQQILAAEMPLIPLFTIVSPGIVRRDVRGVYSSPMWYQPRDWWFE